MILMFKFSCFSTLNKGNYLDLTEEDQTEEGLVVSELVEEDSQQPDDPCQSTMMTMVMMNTMMITMMPTMTTMKKRKLKKLFLLWVKV